MYPACNKWISYFDLNAGMAIYRYIKETDEYYPALLKTLKDTPKYNSAAWLLKYQIESLLDVYKRLM